MKRKIKINRQKYDICTVSGGSMLGLDGLTDFDSNTITVCRYLKNSQMETTLAHEIIHVLLHQSGVSEILKDQEEVIVRSLEDVFYSFLQENTNFYD